MNGPLRRGRAPGLPAGLRGFRLGADAVLCSCAVAWGIASFALAGVAERALAEILAAWFRAAPGGTADLFASAAVEELLRLIACVAFAISAARTGRPVRAYWGVVAAAVFGLAENLVYYAAFPDTVAFLRLAYSQPVHVNAALALAIACSSPKPARSAPVAFALALAYHFAMNSAASAWSIRAVWLPGFAVNAILLFALIALAGNIIDFQGAFRGYRRT